MTTAARLQRILSGGLQEKKKAGSMNAGIDHPWKKSLST